MSLVRSVVPASQSIGRIARITHHWMWTLLCRKCKNTIAMTASPAFLSPSLPLSLSLSHSVYWLLVINLPLVNDYISISKKVPWICRHVAKRTSLKCWLYSCNRKNKSQSLLRFEVCTVDHYAMSYNVVHSTRTWIQWYFGPVWRWMLAAEATLPRRRYFDIGHDQKCQWCLSRTSVAI